MEFNSRTLDVEVEGRTYQLGKMTSGVAAWVYSLFVAASFKMAMDFQSGIGKVGATDTIKQDVDPIEKELGTVKFLWLSAASLMSEEAFAKIQKVALAVCKYYITSDSTPAPVLMADGRFAASELETNPVTANELVLQSLQYNITPFFLASASKQSKITTSD